MKKLILTLVMLAIPFVCYPMEGVKVWDYPDVRITSIQDKQASFPKSLFVSVSPGSKEHSAAEYSASVNVFVITHKASGTHCLIDTGNGGAAKGTFAEKFNKLKLNMRDVKAVFITHIHPDHIGGLLDKDSKPAFPEAFIYIAKDEYDAWTKPAALEKFLAPYTADRLRLFQYGKEFTDVCPHLIPLNAKGHTPGHTVYEYKLPNSKRPVYFVGDILHAADLQIPNPDFCAKFDANPTQAAAARRAALLDYRGYWFGAHFPFPGKIEIVKKIKPEGDTFSYILAENHNDSK